MNLKSAENAKEFVIVTGSDRDGKPVRACCPGHHCKTHQVDIERKGDGISLTCNEIRQYDEKNKAWTNHTQVCSGAVFGVCYHILATMLAITGKTGNVRFFQNKEDAEKDKKEGDRLIPIWSKDQDRPEKYIWLVFTPKHKTPGEVTGKPLRKPTDDAERAGTGEGSQHAA